MLSICRIGRNLASAVPPFGSGCGFRTPGLSGSQLSVCSRSASPGTPPRPQRERASQALFWPALLTPLAIILVAAFVIPLLCAILRISGTPLLVRYSPERPCCTSPPLAVGCRQRNDRRDDRVLGAFEPTSFGQPADQARDSLCRCSDRHRVPDPGGRRPRFSRLLGGGRTGGGGLAVALAARDSVANLLGSMLIMFEKPFRVGDYIQGQRKRRHGRGCRVPQHPHPHVGQFAGINSNNNVVNATIENLAPA